METLITALAPAFAVGLALQALIEWLDSPIEWLVGKLPDILTRWRTRTQKEQDKVQTPEEKQKVAEEETTKHKKAVIRTISVLIGIGLALVLNLHVLAALGGVPQGLEWIDKLVAGFVVSLGTDGVNQIIKFVEKAKDNQEASSNK